MRTMALRRLSLLLACCLLLGACTGSGQDSTPSRDAGPSAINATTAPLLPTRVAALPDSSPDQFDALMAQLKGTPVVVNFWGSWCTPCQAEAPMLAKAARTYGHRIQFLGVDILDDRSGASGFIERYDEPYPSLFDPSGSIRDDQGLVGQPATVFYDADGHRASFSGNPWSGQLTQQALQRGIDQLLP